MPGEAFVPEIGDNFYTKDMPGFTSPFDDGRSDDDLYADDETGYKYAGDGVDGYSHASFIVSMIALMVVCGTVGVGAILYYKKKRVESVVLKGPSPPSAPTGTFSDDPTAVVSNTVEVTDTRG